MKETSVIENKGDKEQEEKIDQITSIIHDIRRHATAGHPQPN
jgi:thymidylate synthase